MSTHLYVELADGTRIGCAETGNPHGPPVVHLHGNPGSRLEVDLATFRAAVERLGIRLLAPDRPGLGLSSFYSCSHGPDPGANRIRHSEDDRLVFPQASRILAAALPHSTTHFVPEAGYLDRIVVLTRPSCAEQL